LDIISGNALRLRIEKRYGELVESELQWIQVDLLQETADGRDWFANRIREVALIP
jgi:hypothetical protein